MKNKMPFLVLFLVLALLSSCHTNTQKITVNNTAIHYTKHVNSLEVQKLGEFLLNTDFANGKEYKVQFTRDQKTGNYIFKLVSDFQHANSKTQCVLAKIMAKQFSTTLFNSIPVEYHFCDSNFKTFKEIPCKI